MSAEAEKHNASESGAEVRRLELELQWVKSQLQETIDALG